MPGSGSIDRERSVGHARRPEALITLRLQLLEAADPGFDQALRTWFRSQLANGSFLAWIAEDASTVVAPAG